MLLVNSEAVHILACLIHASLWAACHQKTQRLRQEHKFGPICGALCREQDFRKWKRMGRIPKNERHCREHDCQIWKIRKDSTKLDKYV